MWMPRDIRTSVANKRWIGFISITIIVILMIPFLGNIFLTHGMMLAFLYAFMALAWNLLCGYCGYFSLGHQAFFGVGAYVTMILMLSLDLTPWVGMIVSGIAGAALAFAAGFPLFRTKSHWFTLATLAFGELIKLIFINWDLVGAANGLEMPIKEESLYWLSYARPFVYYYVILGFLAVEFIILRLIIKSKIGYCLRAIRESETTAMSVGINPYKYKIIAMTISGFFFGIAGGFYTVKYKFIDPFSTMDWILPTEIALCAIVGGLYWFIGPILGAIIVTPTSYYVRAFFSARFGGRFFALHRLIYGLILLIVILKLPDGLLGWIERKGIIKKLEGK